MWSARRVSIVTTTTFGRRERWQPPASASVTRTPALATERSIRVVGPVRAQDDGGAFAVPDFPWVAVYVKPWLSLKEPGPAVKVTGIVTGAFAFALVRP